MKNVAKQLFHPLVIASFVMALLLYSGIINIQSRFPYKALIAQEAVCTLTGTISSNPVKTKGSYYRCNIKLSSVAEESQIQSQASGTVNIYLPSQTVESLYPQKLHAHLTTESQLFETGAHICAKVRWSENTQAFYAEDMQSVYFEKTLKGQLSYLRGKLRLTFKRLMSAWGSAGALILSLLSGAREYTDEKTSLAFRSAGLSHILALSGMHLSFFSSLAGTSIGKVFGKRHLFIPRLLAILLFVLFAGLSPSLFRALLCSLIMMISSRIFCSRMSFLHVLSAVFLIHIVVRPQDCYEIAFILSYLSLAGILIFSDILSVVLINAFPEKIATSLAASVGAQTATAPVSMSVFGCITPIGIFSTVIVSPLISIFLTAAIIAIVLSLCIPLCAQVMGSILNVGFCCIMFFVKLFAAFPAITL